MSEEKKLPTKAAIQLRRYHDDLVVWTVDLKFDPEDTDTLQKASEKAVALVESLQAALFHRWPLESGNKRFEGDAVLYYVDDSQFSEALKELREHHNVPDKPQPRPKGPGLIVPPRPGPVRL